MNLLLRVLFLSCAFGSSCLLANEVSVDQENRIAHTVLRILIEQPESIEQWTENRVYLDPSRITVTRSGVYSCDAKSIIEIPSFAIDDNGLFLLCKHSEVNSEAEKHYSNAFKSFLHGLGHSCGAGAVIECPPLFFYEGYNAVEAFKNAAVEYIQGLRAEGKVFPGYDFPDLPPIGVGQ